MRRLIAAPLIASLLFAGCGPYFPRTTVAPPAKTPAEREAVLREAARKMLGNYVTVTMQSGEKVSGKLRAAGETTLAISVRGTPARSVDLPYGSMLSITRPASVVSWVVIAAVAAFVTGPVWVYGGYPD